MPCHPARARVLLRKGKAAVFLRYPFTIILKDKIGGQTQPISLNVDPGSKTTGIALVAEFKRGLVSMVAINIEHRGQRIKKLLDSRRTCRRGRRSRNIRYRKPRFLNRFKPEGWLPPSLMSRVHNVETWAKKLTRLAPVIHAQVETVRFDMQIMALPNIKRVEYQQGALMDWELREYLLVRHHHTCAYCNGLSGDPVLEKEHIVAKSLGGSNRLSNLVIACRSCNKHKGNKPPERWLMQCGCKQDKLNKKRADSMTKILKGYRPSLQDAAAVNATRYAIGRVIKDVIPNTQFWSGGRTKKNRTEQGYRKAHWIDAACVGETGNNVTLEHQDYMVASAFGHGSRQMCRVDRYGFPRTSAKSARSVKGFKTGDLIKANVVSGKKQGIYTGRVAIRKSGSFNIKTRAGTIQGIGHRHCRIIHHGDGYSYQLKSGSSVYKKGVDHAAIRIS